MFILLSLSPPPPPSHWCQPPSPVLPFLSKTCSSLLFSNFVEEKKQKIIREMAFLLV
jgi:hypothetical protein